jgi:hypothetical protein
MSITLVKYGEKVYSDSRNKIYTMAEGYNIEDQIKEWDQRLKEITNEANEELKNVQEQAEQSILESKTELTLKQEMFARLYADTRNATYAYITAYNVKPTTKKAFIYSQACVLKKNPKVASRIKEIQEDIEEAVGISKIQQIKKLKELFYKCLEPQREMEWREVEEPYTQKNGKVKTRKINKLVPKEDEFGRPVFRFDSKGANSAMQEINKLMGYHAPVKTEIAGKDGGAIEVNNISNSQLDQIITILNQNKK